MQLAELDTVGVLLGRGIKGGYMLLNRRGPRLENKSLGCGKQESYNFV